MGEAVGRQADAILSGSWERNSPIAQWISGVAVCKPAPDILGTAWRRTNQLVTAVSANRNLSRKAAAAPIGAQWSR